MLKEKDRWENQVLPPRTGQTTTTAMIATDEHRAVFWLHQKGMKTREIARRLTLNRNTVRAIIRQSGWKTAGG